MNEGKKGFRAKKHRVAAVEPNKPRNFVAKNAVMGGAGAHKDKKKAQKQGDIKHKKDYAEHLDSMLKSAIVETRQINETGLDPIRRMKAIQFIASKTGWEKNYLELASDEELMDLYVKVKKGELVGEAGYGRNRGYAHGFASPTAPSLNRPKRDFRDEGEPEGMFTVIIDGRPWKEFTSNKAFHVASTVAGKNPDKKVQVRWPDGALNTIKGWSEDTEIEDQGVAEDAVDDFLKAGGKIQYGKPQKGPKRPGLSFASKHIGGGGDKMKASRNGKGANTKGKPVVSAESSNGNISDRELTNIDPKDHGDAEGDFVKNQIHTMLRVLKHLEHAIGDNEDLPEWVEMKLSQAQGMIVGVMDYMISDKEREVERQTGDDALMKEKLNLKTMDTGAVIKDFEKSNAPQFRGKTKAKRRQMAIAAKMGAMKKKKSNEGWTTDTLAAQLFEQELTYEDKLNSLLAKKLSK